MDGGRPTAHHGGGRWHPMTLACHGDGDGPAAAAWGGGTTRQGRVVQADAPHDDGRCVGDGSRARVKRDREMLKPTL